LSNAISSTVMGSVPVDSEAYPTARSLSGLRIRNSGKTLAETADCGPAPINQGDRQ
jgi:hypothetical protein